MSNYDKNRRNPGGDKLRELYHDQRLSLADIGKIYYVSSVMIKAWMKQAGVETKRTKKKGEKGGIPRIPKYRKELHSFFYLEGL